MPKLALLARQSPDFGQNSVGQFFLLKKTFGLISSN
jgi:hypothetical protein